MKYFLLLTTAFAVLIEQQAFAFFYAPSSKPMKATHLSFVTKGMKNKWGLQISATNCTRIIPERSPGGRYGDPYYTCSIETAQGVQCQSRSSDVITAASDYARTVVVSLSVSCSDGHAGVFRNKVHVHDYGVYTSHAPDLQCGGRGCGVWP